MSIAAHPSRVSWLHRGLRRMPQGQGSHAALSPCWHTIHTFRGLTGSSTEGPSCRVRMAPRIHFGTP
eukprot:9472158-Pyramimonas_sp.AAC.1